MEGPLQGVIGSSAVGGAADAKALRAVTEDAGIQESSVDVAGMTLRVDEAHYELLPGAVRMKKPRL